MKLPVFSCGEETTEFDPCMAHAVQVEACELEEGDHMLGTRPVTAGCEEDDAESPPCKRAKILICRCQCCAINMHANVRSCFI